MPAQSALPHKPGLFLTVHLIETMRVLDAHVPLWRWHMERLERSIAALGWTPAAPHLPAAPDGMLRLCVTPGGACTWETRPLPEPPNPYCVGISPVVVAPGDALLYHKTSERAVYHQAGAWAQRRGLADALLLNPAGCVTESTIANLIVEVEGAWYTPPVADGLLPGVMRAVLLATGKAEEKSLRPADLVAADALYLCNAVRGVFPVVLVRSG